MRIIKNVELEKLILIDNTVVSFAAQMENGIYIPPYTGQEKDNELEIIGNFLLKIADAKDVRPFVMKFAGIIELYESFIKNSLYKYI